MSIEMFINTGKIEPLFASEVVLGGLLLDSSQFAKISSILCAQDFDEEFHKMIFNSMKALWKEKKSFDSYEIGMGIGIDHDCISDISKKCLSTKNLESWANIVREQSVKRQLYKIHEDLNNYKNKPENKSKENFASFLEEVAAEVRAFDNDEEYIYSLISELSLATVRYHDELFMKNREH